MATPSRPAPPPPPSRPGQVKVVRALFKYEAQQQDELSFEEGDTLYITDSSDASGWWKARCAGKSGLIPSNYVAENTESIDYPLHEAAKRGNTTFLRECLDNGVSPNGLDKAGSTPLHWAAHGGHVECVQILIALPNVQIDVQNKLGDTALHAAAWKGHDSVVTILLERGANATVRNKDSKLAYDLAKNPESAAPLRRAARVGSLAVSKDGDYLNEEDDDSD